MDLRESQPKVGPESAFAMKNVSFLLAEIHDFTSEEAQQLLHNKFVVVIGDSNYRSVYKDLVYLLQTDEMLTEAQLRKKDNEPFANDYVLEDKDSSRNDYRQVREYRTSHHLVRFYFITRVYSPYVERILNDFRADLKADLVPDVVILHSCLWDLNRYHDYFPTEPPMPKAIREYRQNAEKLFQAMDEVLPPSTLIIWSTALAVTEDARGYIFEQPHKMSARDMIEANFYSGNLAREFWFDVVDLHHHFRFLQHLHASDGTHWNFWAHRYLTKLLLTHIADAWQVELQKQRPLMRIPKFAKTQQPSPWRNVESNAPQPIPTLWTNSSARDPFYSKRSSHFHHNAQYKRRLRARSGQGDQFPENLLRGPEGGLHPEQYPLPSVGLPDPRNSAPGLDSRPISSFECPQPIPDYYPHAPEHGGYDRWPVGSSEQEHRPQPDPNFNSHPLRCVGRDSWPIPSFEEEQCFPCHYDGHSHNPFHASCDATPIIDQEHCPPHNAGYIGVSDGVGDDGRPISILEPSAQFSPSPYAHPFQDGRPTSFGKHGSRFHPNSPPHFPQDVDDANRPSIVEQGQYLQSSPYNYFEATHGPHYDSWAMGLPEQDQWPLLHPRGDLPVHHNVRNGPWSRDGDEGDQSFPLQMEDLHPTGFSRPESFTQEEGWAPYSLPCRIPRKSWLGSRKMLSRCPRYAHHRRHASAPYATSRKNSGDSF